MLAARDQENLIHNQQAAAASKPLNHGLRQPLPKSPGNKTQKTPFKMQRHDENDVAGFGGKSVVRANGLAHDNIATGGKKGVALDRNAFVTPIGMYQYILGKFDQHKAKFWNQVPAIELL